jgi:hypothetical protein
MNRFFSVIIGLYVSLFALSSCDKGPEYAIPDDSDSTADVSGPTKEQLAVLSDFITIAIATDDYCASMESSDSSFTLTTFKEKSVTVPFHLDILPEGSDTKGLENYVIDASRYVQFKLGGETQTLPSDIHQWYNPPLVKGNGEIRILSIGGEFTEDATAMLPEMSAATKENSISVARLLKDGASIENVFKNSEFSYSEALNGASEWSEAETMTITQGLAKQSWDVVTIMENPMSEAGWAFSESTKDGIEQVLDLIFTNCKTHRPAVLLMLGPTLPADSQVVTDNFGANQKTMYDALVSYGQGVIAETGIYDVVSVCTTIQNLRESEVAAASTNGLTCDGIRLDKAAGCFTAAGTVFYKMIEGATGHKYFENSFVPNKSSSEEGKIGVGVSNAFLPICRNAAKYAVESPFEIVDLSLLRTKMPSEELPDVGFIDSEIVFGEEGQGGGDEGDDPPPQQTKTLNFDLTAYDSSLFPGVALTADAMNARFNLKLKDSQKHAAYKFYNAGGFYHGATNAYATLHDGKGTGYLGLPAIAGYKLTGITVNRKTATGATVKVEVLSDVASGTTIAGPFTWQAGNPAPAPITLSDTKENTVYYLHSLDNTYVPIAELTLEYRIAESGDAHDQNFDIFLFIGQSNMAGRGEVFEADCKPMENVYLFTEGDNTVVYAAQPLLNIESTVRKAVSMQKFNLSGPFAQAVSQATGRKVLIVGNARGETTMENWMKGAEPFYFNTSDDPDRQGKQCPGLYSEAVRRTKEAMKYGTLRAIIWHQGEGNANIGQVPYYMPKLKTFVANLRADLGMTEDQLPFIAGELNRAYAWAENLNPYLNTISTEIPNSACASSEGCGANSDNVHFNTDGLKLIGQRYAECYLNLIK